MMMTILTLQQYSIYNVLSGHCKVPAILFRNLSNRFINIFAILQDFNGIFSNYFFNITVLYGRAKRASSKIILKI